ncbi:MAG TPA: glutaredoxin 3 [Steroidobacteraceae bacterium]|nr:glutaredoxin 3 [Steroidobacteraceae bacterium]
MTAPAVTMYATGWCPYCSRARSLLERKGVKVQEIDIERAPEKRTEMQARSGRRSVPQIFIGDQHVGGCDDLHALEEAGKLDALLAGR